MANANTPMSGADLGKNSLPNTRGVMTLYSRKIVPFDRRTDRAGDHRLA
jgi:hypothetical protein